VVVDFMLEDMLSVCSIRGLVYFFSD